MASTWQAVSLSMLGVAIGVGASATIHHYLARDRSAATRALASLTHGSVPLFLGYHEGDRVFVSALEDGYLWVRQGGMGVSFGVEPTLQAAALRLAIPKLQEPKTEAPADAAPQPEAPQPEAVASEHGVQIVDGEPNIVDWNAWMKFAPQAIRVALQEGVTAPEQVLANAFRRLFPEHTWPPAPQEGVASQTWSRMVTCVARVLERPFVPQLRVIS